MSRVLVLGASGFLGSHLCDALLKRGDEVVGVDDLSSSTGVNVSHLEANTGFSFIRANICDGIPSVGRVDAVLNFASPASPPRYSAMPVHTLLTGSKGTLEATRFALECNARFIMASTSEVYGDPTVSPQSESYWGHVNPIGERSCYDEAKRFSEALCMAYSREYSLNLGIARIFNTYGPRLDANDGRVVSNFVNQALMGTDLTVYGSGQQTRSFCYVDDLVEGILALLDSDLTGPVNLGNPHEITMLELAQTVLELTSSTSALSFSPLPADDPIQRLPDIRLASTSLGWTPKVQLKDGLQRTIEWFSSSLK
jgi:dTDP-glucose 4,6-dehydratase